MHVLSNRLEEPYRESSFPVFNGKYINLVVLKKKGENSLLLIASYYRQLLADIKMKIIRIKPVLLVRAFGWY